MVRARERGSSRPRRSHFRRPLAFIGAALAVLSLILAIPQHVTDLDDDGPSSPVVMALTRAAPHAVRDHQSPGHLCADHCAAHVLSDPPALIAVAEPVARPSVWLGQVATSAFSLKSCPPRPPPKA